MEIHRHGLAVFLSGCTRGERVQIHKLFFFPSPSSSNLKDDLRWLLHICAWGSVSHGNRVGVTGAGVRFIECARSEEWGEEEKPNCGP